jgi:Fur family transcriptional regulator, stress-responsive regulator
LEQFQTFSGMFRRMPSSDQLAAELRARNLRVTAPRLAVLRAVAELDGHPDVEAIAAEARAKLGSVSVQAVYDSLHTLAGAGLLRRIEPAGSPARYETRVGDNHHHLVCRGCGRVHDVDCVTGHAPCLDPSQTGGFSIDEAEVTFWGLCPACQKEEPAEAIGRATPMGARPPDSS